MADQPQPPATRWLGLNCTTCWHWVKGEFTKEQIADWFRTHPTPTIRPSTPGVTCQSTCPHPCTGGLANG